MKRRFLYYRSSVAPIFHTRDKFIEGKRGEYGLKPLVNKECRFDDALNPPNELFISITKGLMLGSTFLNKVEAKRATEPIGFRISHERDGRRLVPWKRGVLVVFLR